MFRWIPYTFVRTVIFFSCGILVGLYAPGWIGETAAIVLILLFIVLYFILSFTTAENRRWLNPGVIALPLVFLLGYIHLIRHTASADPKNLIHVNEPVAYYKVVITKYAEEKPRSWKIESRVLATYSGSWNEKTGNVILYLSKSDFADPFRYGDVLLIRGEPQIVPPPVNPGEFDYREFLAAKNIYHQHFPRIEDVKKIGYEPPHIFMAWAMKARLWADSTLKKYIDGHREQAVASALVLGVTDGLDNALLNAYSATGSMHVLAVSGLHISIIYLILLGLLKPLLRMPGGRWMVAIICLVILWMYAFITGLTPSVLRAVVMFSFLAIAKPWARSTNIYNTLALSAFFLLLFDPFMIRSVGFQLSYLAVLGIVYLYPRFLSLWEPKRWLSLEVWKALCVSLAAQIATFALGLLYFHQFPNYFLLSNLLVVPVSFAILILGLTLLAVSFIPFLAIATGFCLEWVIKLINWIVFTIESFPFSLIENVYISPLQCTLLMGLILSLIALAEFRKFKYLSAAVIVVAGYASLQWLHFAREVNSARFTLYDIPGHMAMDFIDRGETSFVADSVVRADPQMVRYHITPNRLMAGVRHINPVFPLRRPLKGCTLTVWHGITILHISSKDFTLPPEVKIDWLIIGNNAISAPEKTGLNLAFSKIILDSSNSIFFAGHFLKNAKLLKLDVHSVLQDGAFVYKIKNIDS
jgi:competence protein ComEC